MKLTTWFEENKMWTFIKTAFIASSLLKHTNVSKHKNRKTIAIHWRNTHHSPGKPLSWFKPWFLPILPNQCRCCNPVEQNAHYQYPYYQQNTIETKLCRILLCFPERTKLQFFLLILSQQLNINQANEG